jgi:hypothetical protein
MSREELLALSQRYSALAMNARPSAQIRAENGENLAENVNVRTVDTARGCVNDATPTLRLVG